MERPTRNCGDRAGKTGETESFGDGDWEGCAVRFESRAGSRLCKRLTDEGFVGSIQTVLIEQDIVLTNSYQVSSAASNGLLSAWLAIR